MYTAAYLDGREILNYYLKAFAWNLIMKKKYANDTLSNACLHLHIAWEYRMNGKGEMQTRKNAYIRGWLKCHQKTKEFFSPLFTTSSIHWTVKKMDEQDTNEN